MAKESPTIHSSHESNPINLNDLRDTSQVELDQLYFKAAKMLGVERSSISLSTIEEALARLQSEFEQLARVKPKLDDYVALKARIENLELTIARKEAEVEGLKLRINAKEEKLVKIASELQTIQLKLVTSNATAMIQKLKKANNFLIEKLVELNEKVDQLKHENDESKKVGIQNKIEECRKNIIRGFRGQRDSSRILATLNADNILVKTESGHYNINEDFETLYGTQIENLTGIVQEQDPENSNVDVDGLKRNENSLRAIKDQLNLELQSDCQSFEALREEVESLKKEKGDKEFNLIIEARRGIPENSNPSELLHNLDDLQKRFSKLKSLKFNIEDKTRTSQLPQQRIPLGGRQLSSRRSAQAILPGQTLKAPQPAQPPTALIEGSEEKAADITSQTKERVLTPNEIVQIRDKILKARLAKVKDERNKTIITNALENIDEISIDSIERRVKISDNLREAFGRIPLMRKWFGTFKTAYENYENRQHCFTEIKVDLQFFKPTKENTATNIKKYCQLDHVLSTELIDSVLRNSSARVSSYVKVMETASNASGQQVPTSSPNQEEKSQQLEEVPEGINEELDTQKLEPTGSELAGESCITDKTIYNR